MELMEWRAFNYPAYERALRRAADPCFTNGGTTMGADVKKVKYALQVKDGSHSKGNFISGLSSDRGHFSFHATKLADAILFDSACEAEQKTEAGRESTNYLTWAVVPVLVTTTTRIVNGPATVQSRTITIQNRPYRVVNGVVETQYRTGWSKSASYAADTTLASIEPGVDPADVARIIELLRNPTELVPGTPMAETTTTRALA